MTAPLFQDMRELIVRPVEAGSSEVGRFEVSPSAAIKLMPRRR